MFKHLILSLVTVSAFAGEESAKSAEKKEEKVKKDVTKEAKKEEKAVKKLTSYKCKKVEKVKFEVEVEGKKKNFTVEVFGDKTPKTCENFLLYVKNGFYDNLIFHRVVNEFVVQGGGFSKNMEKKETRKAIKNEGCPYKLPNVCNAKYTLAMARLQDPHSATSQFYINTKDNGMLDSYAGNAYTVFGKVADGKPVVDEIGKVKVGMRNGMRDVPVNPVTITKATHLK